MKLPIIYSSKELANRQPLDFYPTQPSLARVVCKLPELQQYVLSQDIILDPGAGTGVWGNACKGIFPEASIVGVEINHDLEIVASYDDWHTADYINSDLGLSVDLVIGNPPYKFTEEFVNKSLTYLKEGGIIAFLLRLSFLESKKRYLSMYNAGLNPEKVYCLVQRPNFREYLGLKGSDSDAYGIYIWRKGYVGSTILDWLDWR